MIDTNQIQQLADTAHNAKEQISPLLPALAVAAAWIGRELNRLNAWIAGSAEKVMAHGGIGKIFVKLLWNKGTP